MEPGDKWDSRTYPDGCRGCGQTRLRHIGKGLCNRCYHAWSNSGKDVDEWLSDPARIVPVVEPREGEGPMAAEPESRQGETRPGSVGSAVTGPIESPPGLERKRRGFLRSRTPKPEKGSAPKTNEKRPAKGERRVSTAETVGDVWGAVGGFVARWGASPERPVGKHAPLGRYLQWQALAAGEIVDGAVKETWVDKKVLQPAVRARSSLDALAALLGPPLIIMAIERDPSRAEALGPMLESSIRSSLPTLLPAMKKAKERQEKVEKAVAEMFPDLPAGADPVHEVLNEMFAGYFATRPQPTPEADGVPVS